MDTMEARRPFPFPPMFRWGLVAALTGCPCTHPDHHSYAMGYRMGTNHPEAARAWAADTAKDARNRAV